MWRLSLSNEGKGEIEIDDFRESFFSELSFWSRADYEGHWLRAAQAVKKGEAVSLITSITDPASSNFIRCWACYPFDGELVFQEQILFLDDLPEPFNLDEPHKNPHRYQSHTDDGDKISEWRTKADI